MAQSLMKPSRKTFVRSFLFPLHFVAAREPVSKSLSNIHIKEPTVLRQIPSSESSNALSVALTEVKERNK
ncbi:hypothetical protein pipiens_014119 [Culex pipiens pipiens]|uniref:Uncharacterized protein n=1 Tax=Culex pipiens pipiens TaxID=38569 RepID=A0ABD1CVS9_CULPP